MQYNAMQYLLTAVFQCKGELPLSLDTQVCVDYYKSNGRDEINLLN